MEAQLQCLMSENSIDYMAKFADLADQIASSDMSNKKWPALFAYYFVS